MFLVSWLPYGLTSFYTVFFNTKVDPLIATLPALFAKTWIMWPSLITIMSDNDFKKHSIFDKKSKTNETYFKVSQNTSI
jgi:hypothetical protein